MTQLSRDEIRAKYKADPNWPIQSFDARDWARAFMDTFENRLDAIDESLMLAWFANSLMRGYDEARWTDAPAVPARVPEGWKLVPIEPTIEQKRALLLMRGWRLDQDPVGFFDAMLTHQPYPDFIEAYRTMTAAASPQPRPRPLAGVNRR